MLHNGAGPDFELGTAPVAPTPPEAWTPLVRHDPAVRLEDVDAFAGHLVVHQRSEGLTQLRILELGAGTGSATTTWSSSTTRSTPSARAATRTSRQPTVRLGYTTMAVPSSVYDYDVRTRELTLLRRAPVLGGYDPADYEEHRLWATAEDGEQVPISIVCRPAPARTRAAAPARADPALRVRRLRDLDRPVLLDRPALAARPRRGVRDRARPRRRRDGPPLVRRRQARRTSSTRSPTSWPAPAISSRAAGRRPRRWSRRAPAPAACWWARSRTRLRSCSAASSPGCRSSTT